MLLMWQEERGKPYYRFQTKNRETANKMKRREKFKLTAQGINCDWWIFLAVFAKPETARKALKALAGNALKYDKKEDIFSAPIDISKNENRAA